MDKPVEFRRRGRGYDMNDVNDFISKENIRFNKLEEEYNKKIRDLENEVDDLNKKLDMCDNEESRVEELENEIADLKLKIEDFDATVSEKDAIIDGLKSAADSANEKLDMANSIIDDLRSKAAAAKEKPVKEEVRKPEYYDDAVIEKAQKYDSICNNIDEIFAFAKEEADKIIQEALEMRKQAVRYSPNQLKNEMTQRSKSIIDELKNSFRKQLKR